MAIETPARIAILGAGPIGLEAALYARYLGYDVDIYERGSIAEHVQRWGHVRMFSPFGANRSPLGLAALRAQDGWWQAPPDGALLTGLEYAQRYLIPLAKSDLLVDGLHEHSRVMSVARDGLLKGELAADARAEGDFRLLVESATPGDHGRERFVTADVVIDATGTLGNHNWLGPGGLPAIGELSAQDHIEYGLPDVLGRDWDRYSNRNVLLVGAGHSAATNLVALAKLAGQAPDTWITWVTRRECDEKLPEPLTPLAGDRLAERERLAQTANRLAADDANHVTFFSGTTVEAIFWHADLARFSVRLAGKHAGELEFDRILANVGFRPDSSLYRELQVGECPLTGGPPAFGRALAEQGKSDTGEARSCGPLSLVNREPDFYVLGAKSLGRDSRFLISTGLEQIRELFTIIADRVELDLYATMAPSAP